VPSLPVGQQRPCTISAYQNERAGLSGILIASWDLESPSSFLNDESIRIIDPKILFNS
jgi:hypothetical protein